MTALSEQIGVTPSYISLLEAGERQASREIVLKLGKVFFAPEDVDALDELLVLAGLSPTRFELLNPAQEILSSYTNRLQENEPDFCLYLAMIRMLLRLGLKQEAEEKIYAGMKLFHANYQLQALMANLQLSLKNFTAAASSQEGAILLQQQQDLEPEQAARELADLYANQGLIHYLWGLDQHAAALQEQAVAKKNNKKSFALALEQMLQARSYYEQARSLTPEDVFLEEAYVRLLYSLADLNPAPQKKSPWDEVIAHLVKLICSEQILQLGTATARELSLALVQAYTKAGDFAEAHKLIGLMQICHPEYWLIYYVKACHFSLQAAYLADQEPEVSELLKAALTALEKALRFQHPQDQVRERAQSEVDLQFLRQQRPEDFALLIQTSIP